MKNLGLVAGRPSSVASFRFDPRWDGQLYPSLTLQPEAFKGACGLKTKAKCTNAKMEVRHTFNLLHSELNELILTG